jgi:ABC-type multidrug transport system fused ATPase/permease subunit
MRILFRRSYYRLLFDFLKSRKRWIGLALLLDILSNSCVIAISLALAQAIAQLGGFNSMRGQVLGLPSWSLSAWITALAIVVGVRALADYARFLMRGRLALAFTDDIRDRCYRRLLNAEIQPEGLHETGGQLLRFSGDLGGLQRLIARGILQTVADGILLVMGLVLIGLLSTPIALLVAALVLFSFGLNYLLTRQLTPLERERRREKARLLSLVSATLRHLPVIKGLNRERRFERRFERRNRKASIGQVRYLRLGAAKDALSPFLVQFWLVVVLAVSSFTPIDATRLFIIVLILMSWRTPLLRLQKVGIIWQKARLSLEKIHQLLQTPLQDQTGTELKKQKKIQLEVRDLSDTWREHRVLNHLNFTLVQGTWHTLCLSEGGKTTLVKILTGLRPIQEGQIFWNEVPQHTLKITDLRRQTAVVSAVFPIVGRSLNEALSNHSDTESHAEVSDLLAQWQEEFPALRPLIADEVLKDFYPRLSNSQQVLLQCLRAVLSNRALVVLDEPFAALDTQTRAKLELRLKTDLKGKSVLLLTGQC